jgi:hypothetical protein
VELGNLYECGFLVTLGDCHHLAGLMLVVDRGENHGGCWCLRSLSIVIGFVLIPMGDSLRASIVKSIEVWRGPHCSTDIPSETVNWGSTSIGT